MGLEWYLLMSVTVSQHECVNDLSLLVCWKISTINYQRRQLMCVTLKIVSAFGAVAISALEISLSVDEACAKLKSTN